jgi:hypothetical protein
MAENHVQERSLGVFHHSCYRVGLGRYCYSLTELPLDVSEHWTSTIRFALDKQDYFFKNSLVSQLYDY